MFGLTSRYARIEQVALESEDGTKIAYIRRRFVPQPESLALLEEHAVRLGERLDHIAAARLGDPEMFWRIADANRAIRPEELVAPVGRRLRITLPDGIAGRPNG